MSQRPENSFQIRLRLPSSAEEVPVVRWEAGVLLVGVSQDPGPRAGTQHRSGVMPSFALPFTGKKCCVGGKKCYVERAEAQGPTLGPLL